MQTIQARDTQARNLQSRLTEIVIPGAFIDNIDMILPMLGHLSSKSDLRWFTWVTQNKVDSCLLDRYSFDSRSVRIIRSQHDTDTLWLTWEALKLGNSEIVVADLTEFDEKRRNELERAAQIGNTRIIVIRKY